MALETFVPRRGRASTIETLHDGDAARLVLAVPAVPLARSTRARSATTRAIAFDGACLRGKCEADPALGYELMKRFAAVIVERLQATRLRLLDVYGHVAALSRPRAGPMVPAPLPGASTGAARPPTRGRSSSSRRRRAPSPFAPGQFAMLYAFGVGEVPISVSGDPAGRSGSSTPIRAVGAVDARRSARLEPGDVLGVRGPFGTRAGRSTTAEGARRRRRRRRHRARAAAPGDLPRCSRDRERYGRVVAALRRPLAGRAALPRRARALARRASTSRSSVTVDSADAGWRGRVGVVTTLIARADFDPDHDASRWSAGPEVMMRFAVAGAARPRRAAPSAIYVSLERNMKCAIGHCGHCQLGPDAHLPGRPGVPLRRASSRCCGCGSCDGAASRSSRSGSSPPATAASSALLDCEDELLALAGEVEIAYFLEATQRDGRRARTTCRSSRARSPPPQDAERIREVRARSRGALVTIGACATAGGIQALRNFADVDDFIVGRLRHARVHLDARHLDADLRPRPGRLRAARLPDRQAPAARGDQRLPQRAQAGDRRRTASASSASARGNVCVMVAHGTPCLGPGDPRRLRRAVPVLRPRLLRLLRPDGDAEHRRR